jgi:hypothetical protein
MTIRKREYYQYQQVLVAAYTTDEGHFGVYSLRPNATKLERDGNVISFIYFDRNGDAKKISSQKFMRLVKERGVEELPVELSLDLEPKKVRFAAHSKRRPAVQQ